MRKIVGGFLDELTRDHGARRTQRLMEWICTGYIERFGREHRCQIKGDRRRLKILIASRYYGRGDE